MLRRHEGMIEIVCRITHHVELLHHPLRTHVDCCRHGDNLLGTQTVLSELHRGPCAFRRQPLSPVIGRQSPANLQAGGEVRLVVRHRQSDKANKRLAGSHFDRPQTKAICIKCLLNAITRLVALCGGQYIRKEFHHSRIRVDGGKRRTICVTPATQQQSVGRQLFGQRRDGLNTQHAAYHTPS